MTYEHLLVREGAIATITMNRPERRNALSLAMMTELIAAVRSLAGQQTRAIILAGSGPAFSAGHDLRELVGRDITAYRQVFDVCTQLMTALQDIPQPVIARVHGVATAAGCQLVSMCDLAVASSEARFALPGVNIGVFCTTPAVGVARNVPRKRAMEMLLTGDMIGAEAAAARGLVNEVVAPNELDAAVQRYVDRILSRSPAVIAAGKRAFYRQIELSLADAYALADEAMVGHLGLEDASEGIDAFVEKREARWKGR